MDKWIGCNRQAILAAQRHLKTVLKIEKEAHFLAGQPFAIRYRIAGTAICDRKLDQFLVILFLKVESNSFYYYINKWNRPKVEVCS